MKRNSVWGRFSLLFAAVLLLGASLCPSAYAYVVRQSYARISAVAAETLTTGQVVMLKDADGLAYKADANDAALRPAIGIVGRGGATGATVEIIVQGVVSGWTGLSEGNLGYLSETAAAITQAAPAWNQPLGVATNSTTYYVNFSNYLDTSAITALGTLTQPVIFEGTTANDFETTLTVTDPTADRTVTLPDASGVPILASAVPDAAGAVSGAANSLVFEGATADAHETTVTVTDPTVGDQTWTLPNLAANSTVAVVASSLVTNAPDAANSVTGGSNQLIFEGATADAHESIVTATDPTVGDQTWTLPNLAANSTVAVMASSLVTNAPDAANSVTGASNGLVFEGATANAHETTLTVTDPTADRTVTMPDASGTVDLVGAATHDYAGAAVEWVLTTAEAQASYISVTNANGAVNAVLPAATAGKIRVVSNGSGQTLTIKVTGQAGETLATGKVGIYTDNGTDVVEIYEQP